MKRAHLSAFSWFVCLAALAAVSPGGSSAQSAPPPQSPVAVPIPAANAADVESVDAIVAAVYDVISGPKGQKRDWNRMRSLFVPGGRLMPLSPRQAGGFAIRMLDVNDYIAISGEYLETVGFREREIARRVEEYGNITHVWSTYEGFRDGEAQPFLRGINSMQLMNDGTRWWLVNIFWEAERPEIPLPEKYLRTPTS